MSVPLNFTVGVGIAGPGIDTITVDPASPGPVDYMENLVIQAEAVSSGFGVATIQFFVNGEPIGDPVPAQQIGTSDRYTATANYIVTEPDGSTLETSARATDGNTPNNLDGPLSAALQVAVAWVDADGDQIPDAWEVAHGLDPTNPDDAGYDSDYDRISNRNEFLLGGMTPRSSWKAVEIAGFGPNPNDSPSDPSLPTTLIESLNDLGQLTVVEMEGSILNLRVWDAFAGWQQPVSLGESDGYDTWRSVRMNNTGMAAVAVTGTFGAEVHSEIRVRNRLGQLYTIGRVKEWHSVTDLHVTDSGFVVAKVLNQDPADSPALLRWRKGKSVFIPVSQNARIARVSERGEIQLATGQVYRDGAWTLPSGSPVLGDFGDILQKPSDDPGLATLRVNRAGDHLWSYPLPAPHHDGGVPNWNYGLATIRGQRYFLAPNGVTALLPGEDPDVDTDSDGYTDVFEASYGTDPNDQQDFPATFVHNLRLADLNNQGLTVGWLDDHENTSEVGSGTLPVSRAWGPDFNPVQLPLASRYWRVNDSGHILSQTSNWARNSEDPGDPAYFTFTETQTWHLLVPDTDLDQTGLPDDWETAHGLERFDLDPEQDTNRDGLTDRAALALGLDPVSGNTDGDGIADAWEVENGLNAGADAGDQNDDTDGDGLTAAQEHALGTDAADADSDGDGESDGQDAEPTTSSGDTIYLDGRNKWYWGGTIEDASPPNPYYDQEISAFGWGETTEGGPFGTIEYGDEIRTRFFGTLDYSTIPNSWGDSGASTPFIEPIPSGGYPSFENPLHMHARVAHENKTQYSLPLDNPQSNSYSGMKIYPDARFGERWLEAKGAGVTEKVTRTYLIMCTEQAVIWDPSGWGEVTASATLDALTDEQLQRERYLGRVTFTIDPAANPNVSSHCELYMPPGFAETWVRTSSVTQPGLTFGSGSIVMEPPVYVPASLQYEDVPDSNLKRHGKKRMVELVPVDLEMDGVAEEDEETDNNIVLINADNDNGSAWEADTNDTIPTTRDFEHGGGIGKDDGELKLVEVTAPDEDGIVVKIKISPSDKVKAWKGRDKTDSIGIGADGTLSFPNDVITDFYVEGIKVSDAKGEITMTMEVMAGQQNQVVDTIKFAVGPIYEDLRVTTSHGGFLPHAQDPNILFIQAGTKDPSGGAGEPGAKIVGSAHVPLGSGSNHKGLQFIQNIHDINTRDVFYSELNKQNRRKRSQVPHDGIEFPVLDTVLAGTSASTIFYTIELDKHEENTISVTDTPALGIRKTIDDTKFDSLVWKDLFSIYLVFAYDDGTLFPVASTKWEIDIEVSSVVNDTGGDGEVR